MLTQRSFGDLLRAWRQHRRLSQLDLAGEANISTRHLSCVETGRSSPSREMVLCLSESLDVPLRERNALLVAAGYAPLYPEVALDDPAMQLVRQAVERVLHGHEPYPALAVDRHWTLLSANVAVPALLALATPALRQPPVNVLRLSLHPQGLAPHILNLAEWRAHLLARLRHQLNATGDPVLAALLAELLALPGVDADSRDPAASSPNPIAVPLRVRVGGQMLSLISTTTVFGTPLNVTLAELAVESFFPADEETRRTLHALFPHPA